MMISLTGSYIEVDVEWMPPKAGRSSSVAIVRYTVMQGETTMGEYRRPLDDLQNEAAESGISVVQLITVMHGIPATHDCKKYGKRSCVLCGSKEATKKPQPTETAVLERVDLGDEDGI